MKKPNTNSKTQNTNSKPSDDPKFKKRTSIMLNKLKEKKEEMDELDKETYGLFERSLEDSDSEPDKGQKINFMTPDPKFEKRTRITGSIKAINGW